MITYLFVWNPKRWNWENLEDSILELKNTGNYSRRSSCGNSKSIKVGDRIFLVKAGTKPKGIIGSGYAKRSSYVGTHWGEEIRHQIM